LVSSGSSESSAASTCGASTRMMPPGISCAVRPCVASTAWKACGHGWFLISAVTSPVIDLPRMIVRPLKAAKPATTSAMLARSQVTVMRGSALFRIAAIRLIGTAFTSGPACDAYCATGASSSCSASSSASCRAAAFTTRVPAGPFDDQPAKFAELPKDTRISPPFCSTL
jgi:hypothetical protein